MRTVPVTSPDGTAWSVRIVWRPRWQALVRRFGGWRGRRRGWRGLLGAPDIAGLGRRGGRFDREFWGDLLDSLFIGIALIVGPLAVAALFWWLLLPLLLLAVDAVVVVVLLALAVLARVLLRRPWTVETVSRPGDGYVERHTRDVVGWRVALRTRDEIAAQLRSAGRYPPAELGDPPRAGG